MLKLIPISHLPSHRLTAMMRALFHASALLAALLWVQSTSKAAQEVLRIAPMQVDGQDAAGARQAAMAEQQFRAGLRAADAMMQARVPREAAKAYARLSLQFGDSPELFTRRFIAQVQSRDFPQATMVAALSRLMQQPIQLTDRAEDSRMMLEQLIGNQITVQVSTEWVAQKVSSRLDDKDSLAAMTAWLRLCGDTKRSELFGRRAQGLEPTASILLDVAPEGLTEQVIGEQVVQERVISEQVVAPIEVGSPINGEPVIVLESPAAAPGAIELPRQRGSKLPDHPDSIEQGGPSGGSPASQPVPAKELLGESNLELLGGSE